MRSNSCPKCQGSMAEGYVPHERSSLPGLGRWYRGAPVAGWFGLKLPKTYVDIATWRCQRCGFLEQYAKG
ncbi:PF20097 family protein [Sphingomonas sp. J315]|uniref:PF20097 family protein n=2 Tax=unclassified Sphingomonas TaxID=196159 RepID=UPI002150AB2A|nr:MULTISPECIES: PF20097 family protein [unclassified Sphingomonas]UUY00222.1 PF20097 family protein [Sphingomonas sp. J315]